MAEGEEWSDDIPTGLESLSVSDCGETNLEENKDYVRNDTGSEIEIGEKFSVSSKTDTGKYEEEVPVSFPDEVLEHVLIFVTAPKDRNSVSQVCKAWCRTEQWSRRHVFIGNCYSVTPDFLLRRFPRVTSLTLKGKPRFADFGLVPPDWGAHLLPWISGMAEGYPELQELYLKRMSVSDESLALLAYSFSDFQVLSLTNCEGFSTDGLAVIASQCRNLRKLHLQDSDVEDRGGHWLSFFPDSCTTLEALNFSCLDCDIDFEVLERLVARCPSLYNLGLSKNISLTQLQRLLVRAPQLTDLGTGSFDEDLQVDELDYLKKALAGCKGLQKLSGLWGMEPEYTNMLCPICKTLTYLNLSYAPIPSEECVELMANCQNLQRLLLQDFVEDRGLQAVGAWCRDLEELHVFPVDPQGRGHVTEIGLLSIAEGCPKLTNILYFCRQMTNHAIITMSKACPQLTRFRLCIITPHLPDPVTGQPLDEGFGAIAKNCKRLRRLAVSGKLTDKAFQYIGQYGKKVETLSVAFAGDSDLGMDYVLNGCKKLRKLEIRDCPFGDAALLAGLHQYESMRFLWMSACNITLDGCSWVAQQRPRLNVEIIQEGESGSDVKVEKLYVYRSLVGPRCDMPHFVHTVAEFLL